MGILSKFFCCSSSESTDVKPTAISSTINNNSSVPAAPVDSKPLSSTSAQLITPPANLTTASPILAQASSPHPFSTAAAVVGSSSEGSKKEIDDQTSEKKPVRTDTPPRIRKNDSSRARSHVSIYSSPQGSERDVSSVGSYSRDLDVNLRLMSKPVTGIERKIATKPEYILAPNGLYYINAEGSLDPSKLVKNSNLTKRISDLWSRLSAEAKPIDRAARSISDDEQKIITFITGHVPDVKSEDVKSEDQFGYAIKKSPILQPQNEGHHHRRTPSGSYHGSHHRLPSGSHRRLPSIHEKNLRQHVTLSSAKDNFSENNLPPSPKL